MGIQGLNPKQLAAVESFVSGKNTFVALPTAYGKSIIFTILPLFDLLLGKPVQTKLIFNNCIYVHVMSNKELLEALLLL